MSIHIPPSYHSGDFHCPHCNVLTVQSWAHIVYWDKSRKLWSDEPINIRNVEVEVSSCSYCGDDTFWLEGKIFYPPVRTAPLSNSDLPDSVKAVYDEASDIANQSSRAACALLRLAIEMLLKHLGETGSINEGIKNLVANGLNPQIQQSLDIVRVTGNNAVHPGVIDFGDTTDVQVLFQLVNIIADALITQPKQIQGIYDNLPEDKRKAIEKRDETTP